MTPALLGAALLGALFAVSSPGAAGSAPQPIPVPNWGPGRDSAAVVKRLARADYAIVSRACGNFNSPWAYRGPLGRQKSMKSYGPHRADHKWAKRFAEAMLAGASIDSVWKAPSGEVSCDPKTAAPVYLIRFDADKGRGSITGEVEQATMVLARFDVGTLVLFDAEEPLGMIRMDERADTLWAALGRLLEADPMLRGPGPSLAPPETTSASGKSVWVDELPEAVERVPPKYPMAARGFGIDGMVFLQALVGAEGTVHDAFVISGPPALRDPALKAVWKWKFKPARRAGKPVPVWVAVPVKFTLK